MGENIRVAMKASKGPGKTWVLGVGALWWMVTRPNAKIICTSITGDNLADGLWAELAMLISKSTILDRLLKHTASSVTLRGHEQHWFISPRTWPRDGNKEAQANTLAGIHSDNVMFILDEVGDIPSAVMAAAKAGLANMNREEMRDARLIIAGNPTRTDGPLWDACTTDRENWFVYEISGDPKDPNRAPRVSLQYCEEMLREYGEDSDVYRVNVLGKFPKGQSNTVISRQAAYDASKRVLDNRGPLGYPRILGVDVARYGADRTIIQPRQGPLAYKPHVMREASTMQVAGQVGAIITRWKPHKVFIDVGGVGAGVVDRLLERGFDVVEGVDFGSKALTPRFKNMRAFMWFQLREWIQTGAIPDDEELLKELCGPTFKYHSESIIQLESKDELKKRGYDSPDWADALALTFAGEVAFPDAIEEAVETMADIPVELKRRGVRKKHEDWDYDPYSDSREGL